MLLDNFCCISWSIVATSPLNVLFRCFVVSFHLRLRPDGISSGIPLRGDWSGWVGNVRKSSRFERWKLKNHTPGPKAAEMFFFFLEKKGAEDANSSLRICSWGRFLCFFFLKSQDSRKWRDVLLVLPRSCWKDCCQHVCSFVCFHCQ